MIEDKLRRILDDKAASFDISTVAPPGVLRRARARATAALVGGIVVLFAISGGVVYGLTALSTPRPETRPVDEPTSIPDLARITCTSGGVEVSTPQVRPRRDGVHIAIDNRTDKRAFYVRDVSTASGNHGGRLRPHATTRVTTTFAPGEIFVGCFRNAHVTPYFGEDSSFARLTIEDPEGLWTPLDLACDQTEERRATGSRRSGEDQPNLRAMARAHLSGLQPSDRFARPGYPGTQWKLGEFLMVLRDGQAIATLTFSPGHVNWVILIEACPGSGIDGRAPASAPTTRGDA